ncbi:hypothetical protein C8T65DRAFT_523783, partial [Cerioporus squamosus]
QGELEHRHAKRFYVQTNKITYVWQMAKHQRRRALCQSIRRRDSNFQPLWEEKQDKEDAKQQLAEAYERCVKSAADRRQGDTQPPIPASVHYEVSQAQRGAVNLYAFLSSHGDDPATKGFIPHLCEHLLGRILDEEPGSFSESELDGLEIYRDCMYPHKVVRFNYPTYDMRHGQDSINPRTHPDIMLLANGSDATVHPYWYARIIEVFHVKVSYHGPGASCSTRRWQSFDVLWVRWFAFDKDYPSGFQHRRLPHLSFVKTDDMSMDLPFSFVDPEDVICTAYLMPAFSLERTPGYLPPSKLAWRTEDNKKCNDNQDWRYYYVGM